VLLSIGYSACHWCHVMAHESFEDPETAAYMNDNFVNVKVDREERPDVDAIYMDAVQTMTGHGGWPMTVFLTAEQQPFFAGTYYPKDDRPNHPSFRRVMEAIAAAWQTRRDDVTKQADQLVAAVNRQIAPSDTVPPEAVYEMAYRTVLDSWDREHGGFGGAPKFPQAPTLEFLLRIAERPWAPEAKDILSHTLWEMARGGIYDQVGGGFSRYAVDRIWLVPHFEKMLYDNALLARTYLRAGQVLGDTGLQRIAVETLDYLLGDLRLPDGGFASAEDADSEGVEGKFYVFTADEFRAAAGADTELAASVLGVTEQGNFEGSNVLAASATVEEVAAAAGVSPDDVSGALGRARTALRDARAQRIRPGLDDKAVAEWNGLAIRAFAEAGAALGEVRFVDAAREAASFVLANMRDGDGRLVRSWREGRRGVPGFAADYAAMALGLYALYQATGELEWYVAAQRLTNQLVARFADDEGGGFFTTGGDAETLIARRKDLFDNPTPSGNSLAAEALAHHHLYTGDAGAARLVDAALRQGGRLAEAYPQAVGWLLAVGSSSETTREIAVVGDPTDATTQHLLGVVFSGFRPATVVAHDPGDGSGAAAIPLLAGKAPHDGPPTAYVCRGFACKAPTGDPETLARQLDGE
jgi:uncharacterized protein YyaL (SSP411 family)